MLKSTHLKQVVKLVAYRSRPGSLPVGSRIQLQSPSYLQLITASQPIAGNTRRSLFTSRFLLQEKLEKPEGIGGAPKKTSTGKGRGPVTWVNFAATGAVLLVIYIGFEYAKAKKQAKLDKERRKEVGKAKIGGSFNLIDHNGEPKTSADFHGKWVLLYFGFTHCPDICPDEMEKLGEAYDKLTEASKTNKAVSEPVPLFITVDPERDGVKQIAEYVKEFHPKFIGLTGSVEKVKEACKAFRVYFSAGPRSEDDDYIVDHTIIIYLLDPEGQFVDYYGQTKTAEDITTSVRLQMAKYESSRKTSLLSSLVS